MALSRQESVNRLFRRSGVNFKENLLCSYKSFLGFNRGVKVFVTLISFVLNPVYQ